MKLLFKQTNESVSTYNRSTKGLEFIKSIDSLEDMHDVVQAKEDGNFYPQKNGFILDSSGNEVFDPNYPESFDFGDYSYLVQNSELLDHHDDAHYIRAIETENPWNKAEILEKIFLLKS